MLRVHFVDFYQLRRHRIYLVHYYSSMDFSANQVPHFGAQQNAQVNWNSPPTPTFQNGYHCQATTFTNGNYYPQTPNSSHYGSYRHTPAFGNGHYYQHTPTPQTSAPGMYLHNSAVSTPGNRSKSYHNSTISPIVHATPSHMHNNMTPPMPNQFDKRINKHSRYEDLSGSSDSSSDSGSSSESDTEIQDDKEKKKRKKEQKHKRKTKKSKSKKSKRSKNETCNGRCHKHCTTKETRDIATQYENVVFGQRGFTKVEYKSSGTAANGLLRASIHFSMYTFYNNNYSI